jgi:DNA-binding NarL/FixJ family response regulator
MMGLCFAWKQGFFKTKYRVKIVLSVILFIAAVLSLLRLGLPFFLNVTMQCLSLVIMAAMLTLLFLPRMQKKLSKPASSFPQGEKNAAIMYLSRDDFLSKDIQILEKILYGQKYDSIAIEHNIALSTLKKRIHELFDFLEVRNKKAFLTCYQGYTFKLNLEANEEYCND